jgi:hypothetical protein
MIVKKEKTTKGIWDALAKRHVDKGLANKILTWKFFMFEMVPTNIMEVHLNKLSTMANEVETIIIAIPDEVKVMVLFISLLDIYQNLITTLKNTQPTNWAWDVVNMKLLNEEMMRGEKGESKQGGEVMALMTGKSHS